MEPPPPLANASGSGPAGAARGLLHAPPQPGTRAEREHRTLVAEERLFNAPDEASIVTSDASLDDGYPPARIVRRHEMQQELYRILKSLRNGATIREPVVVHGRYGSGKTVTVNDVLNVCKRPGSWPEFAACMVKARAGETPAEAMANIHRAAEQALGATFERKPRGSHWGAMLKEMLQNVNHKGRHFLLVVDEADKLNSEVLEALLYALCKPTPSATDEIMSPAAWSVWLISHTPHLFKEISETTRQGFISPEKVHFAAYNAEDLREIGAVRREMGLRVGALSDTTLALGAGLVAQEGGNARRLVRAIKIAALETRDGPMPASFISEATMRSAIRATEKDSVEEYIAELDPASAFVLARTCYLLAKLKRAPSLAELAEDIKRASVEATGSSVGRTSIFESLTILRTSGLVDTANIPRKVGSGRLPMGHFLPHPYTPHDYMRFLYRLGKLPEEVAEEYLMKLELYGKEYIAPPAAL